MGAKSRTCDVGFYSETAFGLVPQQCVVVHSLRRAHEPGGSQHARARDQGGRHSSAPPLVPTMSNATVIVLTSY